jgi:DNA (cytosine-5)-methyltransferase 1
VFIVGIRPDQPNTFRFPKGKRTTKKLLDILETDVDEKYFLNQKSIDYLNRRQKENKIAGRGFGAKITTKNGISSCLDARYGSLRNSGETYIITNEINYSTKNECKFGFWTCYNLHEYLRNDNICENCIDGDSYDILDNYETILKNQQSIRKFTPTECFRLQGFPDDYKKIVSDTQLYKQAGNSITVDVLMAIFKNILNL